MKEIHTHNTEKDCEYCKHNKPFKMPEEIIEACVQGRLVIFAGAGISTESETVFPFSLYTEIKEEMKIQDNDISFARLMSKFCKQPNGKAKLLQKIRGRFDYVESWPELRHLATRFHQELSTIFMLEEIVTTNWDDYFETECGAIPMVTEQDFAFWNNPGRKIFKIHGSINNLGSIIATEENYVKCYKKSKNNPIWNYLKHILATKVVVFTGYSFKDGDFNLIFSNLYKTMGKIMPHSYLVTTSGKIEDKFKNRNLTVINTDATFFLTKLKEKLVSDKYMLPDSIYNDALKKLLDIKAAHEITTTIDMRKVPPVIYTTSYQDGMIHAFEHVLALKKRGYYSHECNIINTFKKYKEYRKDRLKYKRYFDVAYIDGYISGIMYLILPEKEKKQIPNFYIFGCDKYLINPKKYLRELKKADKYHKASFKASLKIASKYNAPILQHTPFLL